MRFTNRSHSPKFTALLAKSTPPRAARPAASSAASASSMRRARCFGEAGFAGATIGAIARARRGLERAALPVLPRQGAPVRGRAPRDHRATGCARSCRADAAHESAPRGARGDVPPLGRVLPAPSAAAGLAARRPRRSSSRAIRERRGATASQPHRDARRELLRRGIARGEFKRDLDVAAAADVICQLQADYSARAYRRDPATPTRPRSSTPPRASSSTRCAREAVALALACASLALACGSLPRYEKPEERLGGLPLSQAPQPRTGDLTWRSEAFETTPDGLRFEFTLVNGTKRDYQSVMLRLVLRGGGAERRLRPSATRPGASRREAAAGSGPTSPRRASRWRARTSS